MLTFTCAIPNEEGISISDVREIGDISSLTTGQLFLELKSEIYKFLRLKLRARTTQFSTSVIYPWNPAPHVYCWIVLISLVAVLAILLIYIYNYVARGIIPCHIGNDHVKYRSGMSNYVMLNLFNIYPISFSHAWKAH